MAPITANLSCEYLLGQYFVASWKSGEVGRLYNEGYHEELRSKLWGNSEVNGPLLNFYLLG